MATYKKRTPNTIEAMYFDGTDKSAGAIHDWSGGEAFWQTREVINFANNPPVVTGHVNVLTIGDDMDGDIVLRGHYIVKGTKGYYSQEKAEFEREYEELSEKIKHSQSRLEKFIVVDNNGTLEYYDDIEKAQEDAEIMFDEIQVGEMTDTEVGIYKLIERHGWNELDEDEMKEYLEDCKEQGIEPEDGPIVKPVVEKVLIS